MRSKPIPPVCKSTRAWVQGHLKDKGCYAPCTGQDSAALSAFYHLVECWMRADVAGRRACVVALRATLFAMQPEVRRLAREAIPAIGDWGHEVELWPQIVVEQEERL